MGYPTLTVSLSPDDLHASRLGLCKCQVTSVLEWIGAWVWEW